MLGIALVGTIEELAASPRTQSLVRKQFETNFFGPVNIIKAAIPAMRRQGTGHIMIVTGISQYSNSSKRVYAKVTMQPAIWVPQVWECTARLGGHLKASAIVWPMRLPRSISR